MKTFITSQARELFEQVRANSVRLDSCPEHVFVRDSESFNSRFTCTKCQGNVDVLAQAWYNRGLRHGRATASAKESI